MRLTIAELSLRQGVLGISPCPGGAGFYGADFMAVRQWRPSLVVSFVAHTELERVGPQLGLHLHDADIQWAHLPTADYDTPGAEWGDTATLVHAELERGNKVLLHCIAWAVAEGPALPQFV